MGKNNYNYPLEGSEVESEIGKYKLCSGIGRGGNGDVYSLEVVSGGIDLPKSEEFVIKVLKKDDFSGSNLVKRKQRFKKEVDLTCKIQDQISGIIPIYDSSNFSDDNMNLEWYLMPRAKRYNLNQKCSTKVKLENLKDIGESILKLHELGYAHRDIKLANMLFYHGRLCLSDFGLAYNTKGNDPQITDMHEKLGPSMICPPEMRSAGVINNVDYIKSDVYLFAKTLWIVLTKRIEGFDGEYKRSIEDLRLDNKELQVETMGPIYQLLESATKYSCNDRINMEECLNLIDEQLEIIDGEMSRYEINDWKYNDAIVEFQEKYIPDIETYHDPSDIIKIMTRLKGIVSLRFTEIGRVYGLLALRNFSLIYGNIFEFEIRDKFQEIRRIRAAVNTFEIKKEHRCEMRTEFIFDKSNDDFPLIDNLNEALESSEDCFYLNGHYVIEISTQSSYTYSGYAHGELFSIDC